MTNFPRLETIVIFLGYIIANYYMTRKEVTDRFKIIELKTAETERLYKRRIDELETYIRRVEALSDFRIEKIIEPLVSRKNAPKGDDDDFIH